MRSSIAARANLDLIEENYTRWQRDPESVDSGWAAFFQGFELGELPDHDGAVTTAVEAAEPARARFQREGPRPSSFIEVLPGQPADDAPRHDRGARKDLCRVDRLRVH